MKWLENSGHAVRVCCTRPLSSRYCRGSPTGRCTRVTWETVLLPSPTFQFMRQSCALLVSFQTAQSCWSGGPTLRTSEPRWVYCGGEAWKEIKTVLDGKFIADADRSSESQQSPRVCSNPPPSLNVELGPDLLAMLFRVHGLLAICSSPEVGPFCRRILSTQRPSPCHLSSSHRDTRHGGLQPPRSAGSI